MASAGLVRQDSIGAAVLYLPESGMVDTRAVFLVEDGVNQIPKQSNPTFAWHSPGTLS